MPTAWPTFDANTDPHDYYNVWRHFDLCLEEKGKMVGRKHYVPASQVWHDEDNTVDSLVWSGSNIVLTPATAFSWTKPVDSYGIDNPSDFALIIDDPDPMKVLRIPINDTRATLTGTISLDGTALNYAHPDTLDLSNYEGRKWYIMTGYAFPDSMCWSERIPQWPNAWPVDRLKVTARTDTTITDSTKQWAVNEHAGRHVVLQDDYNTRAVISSNTADTLTLSSSVTSSAVDQLVAVVEATQYFDWSRELTVPIFANTYIFGGTGDDDVNGAQLHQAWNLPKKTYYSVDYDGVVRAAPMVDDTLTWQLYDPGAGTWSDQIGDAQDNDVITPLGEITDPPPDTLMTPFIWRSVRGRQKIVEDYIPLFVENKDYTGLKSIPELTHAQVLPNRDTLNVTGTVTTLDVSASIPYAPIDLYWTLTDPALDGDVVATGSLTTDSDGVADFGSIGSSGVDYELTICWGWTRIVPREFINMYDRTGFVPDWDAGTETLYGTPTSDNPGRWQTRPRSTHYLLTDKHGFVRDSTLAIDLFEDGKLATYVGGNFFDASLSYPLDSYRPGTAYNDAIVQYLAVFVERVDIDATSRQKKLLATSGSVVGGGTFFVDTGEDWWAENGANVTHTGTATGGSTTTLADTTQSTSGFWIHPEWGRWVGHIIRITIGATTYRRLITSHTGTTVGWDEALPSGVSAGDAYEIVEPKWFPLNIFKDVELTLTSADGLTTHVVVVTGSDDSHLFFADVGETIGAGWTWSLDYRLPGTCWMWDSENSEHVAPTGTDPRISDTFPADQTVIPPDVVTRYGRAMKNDWPAVINLNEIKTVLNQLMKTDVGDFTYITSYTYATADGTGGGTDYASWYAARVAVATGGWGETSTGDNLAPYVNREYIADGSDDNGFWFGNPWAETKIKAKAQKASIPTLIGGNVEFYCWQNAGSTTYSFEEFDSNGDPIPPSTNPVYNTVVEDYTNLADAFDTPNSAEVLVGCYTKFDTVAASATTDSGYITPKNYNTTTPTDPSGGSLTVFSWHWGRSAQINNDGDKKRALVLWTATYY